MQKKTGCHKRNCLTLLLVMLCFATMAQQYGNEWIDFTKTYYKFKVYKTGLYRIPVSTLATAGIDGANAEDYALYKNGKEVPLYTSSATGKLPANGYIEFWATTNDGVPDKQLYRDPVYQHSTAVSLFEDAGTYFLLVRPNVAANARYNTLNNDVSNPALPVEPYFMCTLGGYFKDKINPGFYQDVGEFVYSSSYDQGEFWSTADIGTKATYNAPALNNMFLYSGSGAPDGSIKYGAFGNNMRYSRRLDVKVNNSVVSSSQLTLESDVVRTATVPLSNFNTASTTVSFYNAADSANDRVVVSFYELTYPRQFNFGGVSDNFQFNLAPNSNGYYLEITNFNTGNVAPVLLDITTQKRYVGDIATAGKVKFLLPPSSTISTFILASQAGGQFATISTLTPRQFVDYSKAVNQGDFLIVSNPVLYTGSSSNNPVQDYANYRSSVNGGSFNAKVADINELTDQFAYGITYHPSSVKNFIAFARNKFTTVPKDVLLIGKGVNYAEATPNLGSTLLSQLCLVPTFGNPASDNMLSANGVTSPIVTVPIGRLSVITGKEVEDYLQKLVEYETQQRTAQNTIADKLWMKNVLELTGADDDLTGPLLCQYVGIYKNIIEDTLAGTKVTVFCKTTINNAGQDVAQTISNLFENGMSLLTYFGHSASTSLAFNLSDPQNYNNAGKYPIFSVSGCNAGNDFSLTYSRLTTLETISEKFTLAKQRGAIAFVASTHYGIVQYLHPYLINFSDDVRSKNYAQSLGIINREALKASYLSQQDFYSRFHAEQILIHGDPAIKFNFQPKPDYVIEDPQVLITPSFISLAEGNCKAFIRLYNLGKAVKDSITLEVKHIHADGTSTVLYRQKMKGIYYSDSVTVPIPIIASKDKGTNKVVITIDADNVVDEVSESNNSITKEFFIYEDEARPAYPYNYSIVNTQGQKLYASTSNPFSEARDYVMEIDTTALFNSGMKRQVKLNSVGGVIEFNSGLNYLDSVVYYWRVSIVPQAGDQYHWNMFSFIYLSNSTPGFNQSHYYQHQESAADSMSINSNRAWQYASSSVTMDVTSGVLGDAWQGPADFVMGSSRNLFIQNACGFGIVFNVFDPITFKLWKNPSGLYNSKPLCGADRLYNFQYDISSPTGRINAYNFLNSIPDKAYVVVRVSMGAPFVYGTTGVTYAKNWQDDTTVLGHNKSLYHKLLQEGFINIDSFNAVRTFILIYRNNDPSFVAKSAFSIGTSDHVTLSATGQIEDYEGDVVSPTFGPAKAWKQFHWRGNSTETPSKDSVTVQLIGVDNNNNETLLKTLQTSDADVDISSIDAKSYPNLKFRMYTKDSVSITPYQLKYWRVNYDPVPEGAIAANMYFKFKDTLDIGEKVPLAVAFKNISQTKFDSILVKMTVTDKDNVAHVISLPKTKPLIAGDTVTLKYDVDTKDFSGNNTMYVNFNPDFNQPEAYLYNNFFYKNFYVKGDNTNPMMDVTFDGVHILNQDIVSAKPHILIKLKDNAKYLLLNDTSLLKVRVKFPSPDGGITPGEIRSYKYDNDTLRFIPAQSASDNTASIEFTPSFENSYSSDGDNYELILSGKDKSGNAAGQVDYRIGFTVISKPMISNLLNYPNPFTTSTAFVFTITGSEIPQQFKIQILTITGKVVREITKDELGPLHIGRNITEFKWDGTDQFGQRLANGVYIYRVVTTLDGKKMDKYKAKGDDTDKFFNSGYGKMYLMR
ncbi:C25 family cysteine peptidase [Pinibacter soli]|uniref:C25 family cysteine peptidase n=1 Tax=Pinibacter soli TaxID=3044211 RepID=A0ABT6RBF9_9BACT|nr:C25 family cysteine peptidase [Pinibacter soli]MDI3319908.1 C25 family cysteine peptidase [Pinibacter soli]